MYWIRFNSVYERHMKRLPSIVNQIGAQYQITHLTSTSSVSFDTTT